MGEVKASKNRLSSSTGVKAGRMLEKLDLVLIRPLVNAEAERATGAPLARLSISAAAFRADFDIRVADPSEVCFL